MLTRALGALARALLIGLVILMPALILPSTSVDAAQIVALLSLFAAVLTFIEYFAKSPSLVEFRDAPPFNRVRFSSLFLTVLLLTLVAKGQSNPTTLTQFIEIIGQKIAQSVDFPYSPVRLILMIVPEEAPIETFDLASTAAGLAYMVTLVTLVVFVLLTRVLAWPGRDKGFNIWVNMPTFDASYSSDIVRRLRRDARFNVGVGLALPFLVPVMVEYFADAFDPISMESPQTMIWMMTLWSFLPTSLFMRGIAMLRIADMIAQRRRENQEEGSDGLQPV